MSDTPRTDAVGENGGYYRSKEHGWYYPEAFVRELERELNEANEKLRIMASPAVEGVLARMASSAPAAPVISHTAWLEQAGDHYDTLKTMDGFEDCVIGIVERFGMSPVVLIDKNMVLKKLQKDGCSEEEAVEFYEFNQLGGWHGDGTPCFLVELAPDAIEKLRAAHSA